MVSIFFVGLTALGMAQETPCCLLLSLIVPRENEAITQYALKPHGRLNNTLQLTVWLKSLESPGFVTEAISTILFETK